MSIDPILHMNKHKDLHASLDELIAEFLKGMEYTRPLKEVTLLELLEWSYKQTVDYEDNCNR